MGMTNTSETVTRYVGHCQICEGEFKLTPGTHVMVHHGYKRPGHGFIVGDCMAVGELAYEQSCEVLKDYTVGLKKALKSTEEYLIKLEAGEIKTLQRETWPNGRGYNAKPVMVDVHMGEPEFARTLESTTWSVKSKVRWLKSDVVRCEARIAAWKLLPVRTVEEQAREEQAARDAAKAVRDAAKAKRQEEARLRQEKADALKAKRAAIVAEFRAGFEKLAAGEITHGVKVDAIALANKVSLKKYENWLSARDLGCDDALIKLGLAETTTVGAHSYVRYLYPLYG